MKIRKSEPHLNARCQIVPSKSFQKRQNSHFQNFRNSLERIFHKKFLANFCRSSLLFQSFLEHIFHKKIRNIFIIFFIFYVTKIRNWPAAIAPWFRLRLPSCGRGFESKAHHLSFLNNKTKQNIRTISRKAMQNRS